jgi:glycosyltransferase involved in cell wall biosynthesis
MRLSLLYPSRGRAKKCLENLRNWTSKCDVSHEIIVATDSDDPQAGEYAKLLRFTPFLVHNNKSVVEATNRAASVASGDVFIYVSDDFDCPHNFGSLVLGEFVNFMGNLTDKQRLLKVDDCLQKFDVPVLTIPIMNRSLYETLGYFWHPDYKSMFFDEDLYWTCKNNGWLKKAPHLKFPHNHVSIGKAENDETYKRSAANWDQGKATFARRKAAGFPL